MRVVADTNVVVSGLLWKGVPSRILEAAEAGDIRLFSSGSLLEELEGVLQREKFSKKLSEVALDAVAVVQRYRDGISIVVPASLGPVITDDPQMTMRYSPVRWPPGPRRSSLAIHTSSPWETTKEFRS